VSLGTLEYGRFFSIKYYDSVKEAEETIKIWQDAEKKKCSTKDRWLKEY
ncbi:unnamed protein product, partial [marine sediment metagenome]